MLNVEERFMIREMYRRGVSVSEIARETGHDRKTVRRAIAGDLQVKAKPREPRKKKLTAYEPYLDARLAEKVYNAHKLYDELRRQGYEGSETLVRDYVRARRPVRAPTATVRYETAPGEQGQVDWGYFGYIEHEQRQRRLYAFVLTLGWSRAIYLEFTVSTQMPSFLRCHLRAFDYLGGMPQHLLYDNLKTAVMKRENGIVHWNPTYLDFADYYGFVPKACQPYRPQTKGKVESGVKYVRNNFWVGLHYTDLDDLNQQAVAWLDQVANVREHGTTHERPCDRLAKEPLLSHTVRPPYDTSECSYRMSGRDCLVSYGANFYSVPAAFAEQRLLVKVDEHDQLRIFSPAGEQIASHSLFHERYQRSANETHYAGLVPAQHPPSPPAGFPVRREPGQPQQVLSDAPLVEMRPLNAYQRWLEEQ